jgi:hypothetical protein
MNETALGIVELLGLAAIGGTVTGAIGSGKGRRFLRWWIYGFAIFPVAFIHAMAIAPLPGSRAAVNSAYRAGRMCPFCRTMIPARAGVCPRCTRGLPPL